MKILAVLLCFSFSANLALAKKVVVKGEPAGTISFKPVKLRESIAYLLTYRSPEFGTYHRAVPRQMFQSVTQEMHSFENKDQNSTIANNNCQQRIVLQDGGKPRSLCGSNFTASDRRKFNRWFNQYADVALGKL